MVKELTAAFVAALLISCTYSEIGNSQSDYPVTPVDYPSSSTPAPQLPEVAVEPLPAFIEDQIRILYAKEQKIPETQVNVLRYSREVWRDSCLGLGKPDEICLFTLTEGWQIQATDAAGENSRFYRSDRTGEQIQESTLEINLPPSIESRIFQTVEASSQKALEGELTVVAAAPRVWDGCFGIGAEGDICRAIAIFGWKATVTDGQNYWVYHTDGTGNTIVLAELYGQARQQQLAEQTSELDQQL